MSDPKSGDLGDWALTVLAGLVIGVLTAAGTIAGWFTRATQKLDTRIDDLECEMGKQNERRATEAKDMWKIHSEHEAQLRELRTCQNNTSNSLAKLELVADKISVKLDAVLTRGNHGHNGPG